MRDSGVRDLLGKLVDPHQLAVLIEHHNDHAGRVEKLFRKSQFAGQAASPHFGAIFGLFCDFGELPLQFLLIGDVGDDEEERNGIRIRLGMHGLNRQASSGDLAFHNVAL